MSSPVTPRSHETPLMVLIHRANRELQADVVRQARDAGYDGAKPAHNALFATLPLAGARTADLAERAGVTRQSMGEVVRELVDQGVLEMRPDPHDRRAKLVTYTEAGLAQVRTGRAHIIGIDELMVAELGVDGYECLRHGLDTLVEVLRARDA